MKSSIGVLINARKYGKPNPRHKTAGARRKPWSYNTKHAKPSTPYVYDGMFYQPTK